MNIAIIGDNPSVASGFGNQVRLLAEGFVGAGQKVTVLAVNPPHKDGLYEIWHNRKYGTDISTIDADIESIRPDAVICFYHTQAIKNFGWMRSAPANCPVFYWLPWEGSTLPKDADKFLFNIPPYSVVHLSEFAQNMWKDIFKETTVIPHCFDSRYLEAYDVPHNRHKCQGKDGKTRRQELIKKWSKRLKFNFYDDAVIVINSDRNIYHKRWDACFDYVKRLKKIINKPVQLIAHTVSSVKNGSSYPGYDLPELEKLYEIEGDVAYTGFDWFKGFTVDELIELYSMVNFRLTFSSGEGFGIITVECAAVGCPQLVSSNTTAPELLGNSESLVNSRFKYEREGALWAAPDVSGMVQKTAALINTEDAADEMVRHNRKHVEKRFTQEIVTRKWLALIEQQQKAFTPSYYGFNNAAKNEQQAMQLASLLTFFTQPNLTIFEYWALNDLFLKNALNFGLNVLVRPSKSLAIESKFLKRCIDFSDADYIFPKRDILVCTDAFDALHTLYTEDQLHTLVQSFAKFKWLFLRFGKSYKWGHSHLDEDTIIEMLPKNLHRRSDLEKYIKEQKAPGFEHQIWQGIGDSSEFPPELMK